MPEISKSFISVKFDAVGRRHPFLLPEVWFDPPLEVGDDVVVATGDRRDYGTVSPSIRALDARRSQTDRPPGQVIRRGTKKDVTQRLKQEQRERDAYRVAGIKIKKRGLAMKLVRVEQQFNGSRLIFYFSADGRIDFRGLVRELAAEFRSRIEMRQIGVRDEARLLGGYGTCGRPLCRTTWLQSFEPISIKMAKRQNLSLNPSRLSGLCGRLQGCLRYELPNASGERFAGCANEGGGSRAGGRRGGDCTDGFSACGSAH